MECLGNIRFIQEKKLVHQFFTEIQMDTGKACFMIGDTLKCLEMGAVETLILWEQFPDECKVIRNRETKEEKMILMTETVDDTNFETLDTIPFIDWIANNYKNFGTKLEFITDYSHEGSQFVKGFSGIGGLMRWKVDLEEYILEDELEEEDNF
jgi:peptide chain release factor subunit 1